MKIGKPRQAHDGREYISMKIPLRAELKGRFADLAEALGAYPNLQLCSKGTELKYAIDCGINLYLFTFGRSHIVEEVFSTDSPVYHLRDALLRMLSVMAYLGDLYAVRIESIFPYLIAALREKQMEIQIPKAQSKPGSDLILAKRIIELADLSEQQKRQNGLLEQQCARLLFHLVLSESAKGPFSKQSISKKYNADERSINRALALAPSFGYRSIQQDLQRLSLVME
ncbi:MAG: hypothetical protein KGH54_00370 [Candidatus Micrarchaeota archaeon]|nr:hypothetical protein [Candidatus Micrarchaeota archaeon]